MTYQTEPEGMMVHCRIAPSNPRLELLRRAGATLPPYPDFRAVIDTGACSTCIDQAILDRIGVPPSGVAHVHTPSTKGVADRCYLYDVSLIVSVSRSVYPFFALPVIGCELAAIGIEAMIGRDVLSHLFLTVNGPEGTFTLGF